MEIPFSKLMNLDVFTDGIRFHASNRQKAPLFKMQEGMGDVTLMPLMWEVEPVLVAKGVTGVRMSNTFNIFEWNKS